MDDEGPDRNGFEDVARALAEEANRVVERLSEIDVEGIARTVGEEAERARHRVEELARALRQPADTARDVRSDAEQVRRRAPASAGRPVHAAADEDPLRNAGPHPLDLPSADQGLALAALHSGRWRLEPGTSALAVHGEGPGPSDALGLVRELRVRDWMTADGVITLAGRKALERWLDVADQG